MAKDSLGRGVNFTEEASKAAEALLNKWLGEEKDTIVSDNEEKNNIYFK